VLAFNNAHDINQHHFTYIDDEEESNMSDPKESEVSDNEDSDFGKPVKPKKGRKKKKPRLPLSLPSEDVAVFRLTRMAYESLSHLLDSERLNAELEELQHGHRYQTSLLDLSPPPVTMGKSARRLARRLAALLGG
jgi:hypothetical protein